jgi:ribokinase
VPKSIVVVLGQAGRDLVLQVNELPEAGGSSPVRQSIERLGGKGANQAVALAQLGLPVALIAVLGQDAAGANALEQARDDGIDVSAVVRRGRTALLVDLVEQDGTRRLLEDVPQESLLRTSDVVAAAPVLCNAAAVSLQLQQPAVLLQQALELVPADALVVVDGAPDEATAGAALLARAGVLRADAREAELIAGRPVKDLADARRLLDLGPDLVAVGRPDGGNLLVWAQGQVALPPGAEKTVDVTGGGDSFTAALIAALSSGAGPEQAGRAAARAAASTVQRLGGRPALDLDVLNG